MFGEYRYAFYFIVDNVRSVASSSFVCAPTMPRLLPVFGGGGQTRQWLVLTCAFAMLCLHDAAGAASASGSSDAIIEWCVGGTTHIDVAAAGISAVVFVLIGAASASYYFSVVSYRWHQEEVFEDVKDFESVKVAPLMSPAKQREAESSDGEDGEEESDARPNVRLCLYFGIGWGGAFVLAVILIVCAVVAAPCSPTVGSVGGGNTTLLVGGLAPSPSPTTTGGMADLPVGALDLTTAAEWTPTRLLRVFWSGVATQLLGTACSVCMQAGGQVGWLAALRSS